MKKLIFILAGAILLCGAALGYIAIYLTDTLVTERNQARTLPARMAKLNKVVNQEQAQDETPVPLNENHSDEESK